VASRVGPDGTAESVVEACGLATEKATEPLLTRVRQSVAQTMTLLAPSRGPVSCAIERRPRGVLVELSGPRVGKDVVHALAVRVADAIRAEGQRYRTLDVSYRAAS
jgi:hypothetical protein